jgi:hypothetical protein
MNEIMRRVLTIFSEIGDQPVDLHTLFEAGGNDPAERDKVVDVVEQLVKDGVLEERGSDFYALTDVAQRARNTG